MNIHIHTHMQMYMYTYLHTCVHTHTHDIRAAYMLFIYLLVFFVLWYGRELDPSLPPFSGFDGLLEEEALLCLLFLPTLCHDDSLSPSSIDSSLLLVCNLDLQKSHQRKLDVR